jgi:hypothetical protein
MNEFPDTALHNISEKYASEFKQLETRGWAVFPDVVPADICDKTYSDFSDWYSDVTGGTLSEFNKSDYGKLFPRHGILTYPQALSHADFVTRVRDYPQVRKIFIETYHRKFPHLCIRTRSNDKTIYGFDRINYQPSPDMNGYASSIYRDERYFWWHVDQHAGSESVSYQSYIDIKGTLSSINAGLQVVDGSHLDFDHLSFYYSDDKPQWRTRDWGRFLLSELTEALPDWSERVVNVTSNKGDLVMWNSKVLHMSRRNTGKIRDKEYTDERFVIYSCHWPDCSPYNRDTRKRKLFERNLFTSSHYPDCRARMRVGDTYGKTPDPFVEKITRERYVTKE